MKLLILGATGGIGRHLLDLSLARGHEVTAFARAPQKIAITHERLKAIPGDLLSVAQLAKVLPGHDAVLSAFGPVTLRATTTRRDFGSALATAMQQSGVRRVLLVSAAFLFPNIGVLVAILRQSVFRNMVPDMAGMEAAIRRDGIDWTIVRPPRLTNGPMTHAYRIADGNLPKHGSVISRADVADFMVQEAEHPAHVGRLVGVCR